MQLVADAFQGKFDYAMLFSNDSDMAGSVEIATKICNRKVGLYVDERAVSTKVLQQHICYIKKLGPAAFAAHQSV